MKQCLVYCLPGRTQWVLPSLRKIFILRQDVLNCIPCRWEQSRYTSSSYLISRQTKPFKPSLDEVKNTHIWKEIWLLVYMVGNHRILGGVWAKTVTIYPLGWDGNPSTLWIYRRWWKVVNLWKSRSSTRLFQFSLIFSFSYLSPTHSTTIRVCPSVYVVSWSGRIFLANSPSISGCALKESIMLHVDTKLFSARGTKPSGTRAISRTWNWGASWEIC